MKTAKYFTDGLGLLIQTDFELNTEEKQYKFCLDEIEHMPGVERVQAGRYFIEIAFGFLFEYNTTVQQVLDMFTKIYQVPCTEQITEAERLARIYGFEADSTAN